MRTAGPVIFKVLLIVVLPACLPILHLISLCCHFYSRRSNSCRLDEDHCCSSISPSFIRVEGWLCRRRAKTMLVCQHWAELHRRKGATIWQAINLQPFSSLSKYNKTRYNANLFSLQRWVAMLSRAGGVQQLHLPKGRCSETLLVSSRQCCCSSCAVFCNCLRLG